MRRAGLPIFFAVLVLAVSGCQSRSAEDFLTSTVDPSELEKVRALAASINPEPLSAASIAGMFVYSRDSLPRDIASETVRERLESVIRDVSAGSGARGNAAILLTLLDPSSGQKRILSLLNELDAGGKSDLLFSLGFVDKTDLAIDDPLLIPELLSLMGDREAGENAIRVCGGWNLPRAASAMWKTLPAAEDDIAAELLFWLSRLEPARKTFNACVERIGALSGGARSRCLTAIGNFTIGKDPALVQEACEFLAREGANGDIPQSLCSDVLQRGNGPLTRGLAARIFEEGGDTYLKSRAYTAFRRWEGGGAQARLAEDLGRPGELRLALDAIGSLYAGSGDAGLTAALSMRALDHSDAETLMDFARTLMAVGGGEAEKAAAEIAERLPAREKRDLLAELHPVSPHEIARGLAECGILEGIDPVEFIERCMKTDPEAEPDLLGLLGCAGILLWFDVETGEIPVRHDRLILDFAGISGGAFRPEACNERMLRKNPEDYEAPYEVQFINAGRLYRLAARNFGDWYDLERIVFACRKAVADSGERRTFYQVATGDQTAIVVFCLPEQAKLLSEKYFLAYEEDPESSMRSGKEFESKVMNELQ